MQLKHKKIAGILSAASCSLLGTTAYADENPWQVDTAVLLYSETDRVSALEPVISAKKDLGDDEILSMKLVLDSLTGASANGAVPSTQPQTFTRPSGKGSYTIDANETPLDDTFRDTRLSYSLNWDKPVDRFNRRNLGFNVSQEYDFTSVAGNALWSHDMNQKNTTLTGGLSVELDVIDPVGGTPVGLTDIDDRERMSSSEDRTLVDLLFGVTQVIDQNSLFQVNYSYSNASGYMTDPYKILSIVDDAGEPVSYVYENRPDERTRQSIYAKYKRQLDNRDIVTASYRYMTDDWGIDSHTLDLSYRLRYEDGWFVQPRLRYYQQSAADFYQYFFRQGDTLPTYASADYRLGEMTGTTVGVKFGKVLDDKHIWSVRIETYTQSGDSSPDEAFGQLVNQDLYPDVDAAIVQFSYSFEW